MRATHTWLVRATHTRSCLDPRSCLDHTRVCSVQGLALARLIFNGNNRDEDKEIDKYLQQALKLRESLKNFSMMADTHNSLGSLAQKQKEFAKAEKWYVKSLDTREDISAATIKEVQEKQQFLAQSYTSLGNLYLEMEEYDKALVNLQHAKECYVKGFNAAHPKVAWAVEAQAAVYKNMKNHRKAQECIAEAIAIRRALQDKGDGKALFSKELEKDQATLDEVARPPRTHARTHPPTCLPATHPHLPFTHLSTHPSRRPILPSVPPSIRPCRWRSRACRSSPSSSGLARSASPELAPKRSRGSPGRPPRRRVARRSQHSRLRMHRCRRSRPQSTWAPLFFLTLSPPPPGGHENQRRRPLHQHRRRHVADEAHEGGLRRGHGPPPLASTATSQPTSTPKLEAALESLPRAQGTDTDPRARARAHARARARARACTRGVRDASAQHFANHDCDGTGGGYAVPSLLAAPSQ